MSGRVASVCAGPEVDRQTPGFLVLKRHSLPLMVAFRRHDVEPTKAFLAQLAQNLLDLGQDNMLAYEDFMLDFESLGIFFLWRLS